MGARTAALVILDRLLWSLEVRLTVCVCVCVCVCVYMYVCMYVCVYMYILAIFLVYLSKFSTVYILCHFWTCKNLRHSGIIGKFSGIMG